jgi:hypothetical protein
VDGLDLAILQDESVALGTAVAEDGYAVKVQLESTGELASRVGEEADLEMIQPCSRIVWVGAFRDNSRAIELAP